MKKFIQGLMAGGMLFAAAAVRAADGSAPVHPLLNDRFFLAIGGFWSDSSTKARVNSGTIGIGAEIDFEQDLGLDERKAVPIFMFGWRFAEHWRLEVEHYDIDRDNRKTVSRDFQFGNHTYTASTEIGSKFKLDVTRASVGWSMFKTTDKELGIGLGVHQTRLQAALDSSTAEDDAKVSAPLPVFSLYSAFALTDRWLFQTRFDRLQVKVGDTDGGISNIGIDLVYQPFRHVNFGLGYRALVLKVESTKDRWRGDAEIRSSGPTLFIGTTF
jgi:hypothetical protein